MDVRKTRDALGLTQAALADAIGVNQGTVSRWESGVMPVPPWGRKLLELLAEEAKRAAA